MAPHVRVILFCVALLAAPVFWVVGDHLGGEVGGAALSAAVVLAAAVYAQRGQRPRPPTGVSPS